MLEIRKKFGDIYPHKKSKSKNDKIMFLYHFNYKVKGTKQAKIIKPNECNKNNYKYQIKDLIVEWNLFNGIYNVFLTGIFEYKEYYKGSLIEHSFYKDDKVEGEYKRYYLSGNFSRHCYCKGGKIEGEDKFYYDNMVIKEHSFYKDCKLEGDYKEHFYNGKLSKHHHFKNNKLEGEYKEYYYDGNLKKHCYYKDGKLDGEFKIYSEDGKLDENRFYKDGIEQTIWNKFKNGIKQVVCLFY